MRKFSYNYVIVGCCFLFLFVNLGMASTSFSVHQPYIVAIDGIGDSAGSILLAIRVTTSLIATVFVERYFKFFNIRRGVFIATMATTLGFVTDSYAASVQVFALGSMLFGIGYGFGGMVALTYIANRWFKKDLGVMVGFASMGSGAATIFMPMVVVAIIQRFNLSHAFIAEAAIALAVGLLTLAFLRNDPPPEKQAEDSSTSKLRNPAKNGAAEKPRGRETTPTQRRWLLAAMTCVGIFSCCGVTYIAILATSSGYEPLFAAGLVSIAGIALTIAKFVTGELMDHIGVAGGSAVVFAVGILGYALCCLAPMGIPALMIAGAILTGAGISLGSVGISVWSIDLSSPANRNHEIRNFQLAYTFGCLVANGLPGIIKDAAGSYVYSYGATLLIGLLGAVIILSFYRRQH